VLTGVIGKFALLALVPVATPDVATVYHLIELPIDVAFKVVLAPEQITLGVAITELGKVH
jgi:hypothetical protein